MFHSLHLVLYIAASLPGVVVHRYPHTHSEAAGAKAEADLRKSIGSNKR